MTIHHDSAATELPASVRVVSQPVTGLESLTGADLAVSPPGVRLPGALEDNLLCRELVKQCYLIQYKRGLDLPSSLGKRLNSSLARMREWAPRPCQRVLLTTGVLTCRQNGCALVNGRESRKDFWPVWSAAKKWCDRGGVVWPPLSRESLLAEALHAAERHLGEYASNPVKEVWPKPNALTEADPDDPLQMLVVIKDARLLLATLPGIGTQRANDLWEHCGGSAALALTVLTTPELDRPRGIGLGTVEKTRNWLGVPDGYTLLVHGNPYEFKEEEND